MSTITVTLDESYARCKELNKRYGTTYYWSTKVLPRVKQHHVWALYAFCRYADDIVDDLGPVSVERRADALADFGNRFFLDLAAGHSDDPVLKAVVHTVKAFDIDPDCFQRFLRSMTMDLTVATYETWDDLLVYMDGSAAVIGEMMLPILEPLRPEATAHARDLGLAMLPTESAKCIGAARVLYGGILERIEAQQYDVFAKRARVPTWRKALMVAKLTSPFGR